MSPMTTGCLWCSAGRWPPRRSRHAAGMNPNWENNERNTVVLFGDFGNRNKSTEPGAVFPVKLEICRRRDTARPCRSRWQGGECGRSGMDDGQVPPRCRAGARRRKAEPRGAPNRSVRAV